MSVKQRLIDFAKSQEKSVRAFEMRAGLNIGYINAIRVSIQPDKLRSIVLHYPNLNPGWLMSGEGSMLRNEALNVTNDDQLLNPTKSVPYWNLPVRAGRSLEEVIGQTKPDGYVVGLPGADMAENILPVVGTSMDPEVSDGALIGVRKMNNWETLNTERIYLIITREERMIKRIEHDNEDEGILWCTSPNYKKFKIYKSDIIEIQRVCFVYNPK